MKSVLQFVSQCTGVRNAQVLHRLDPYQVVLKQVTHMDLLYQAPQHLVPTQVQCPTHSLSALEIHIKLLIKQVLVWELLIVILVHHLVNLHQVIQVHQVQVYHRLLQDTQALRVHQILQPIQVTQVHPLILSLQKLHHRIPVPQ